MFASALVQYNSTDHSFSSNFRYRWEYQPGSELFVVYTDERDTLGTRLSRPEEPRLRRENQSPAALLALASRWTRLGVPTRHTLPPLQCARQCAQTQSDSHHSGANANQCPNKKRA